MSQLDRLFDEIVKVRGPLKKGSQADKADYAQVWDALNRYLTVTHQKRQTLNVHNFCKIGWRVEEFQGKARLRPHFQLAETFMRVFNLEAKAHQILPERSLSSVEEFNFSKAAIRYSQSLTKDNVFMGLRAIVHQIGEVAAREQITIDFELGQLVCKDRDVQFFFAADIYLQEGLEVPDGAMRSTDYKPSVTFGAPSEDALSLNLQGKNPSLSGRIVATHLGGLEYTEDIELSPRSAITNNTQPSQLAGGDGASVASLDVGRDLAHVEALNRHISRMEADAAKAISEKHLWEGHLERCNGLEQKDVEWRRAIARDHAEQLKLQMRHDEDRRAQGREDLLTHMNMHDFPCFKDAPDSDVRAYLHERRANLKQDLDQQVEARNQMLQIAKQRENELSKNNIEASQFEVNKIRDEDVAKKKQERVMLAKSWDQDVRLRTVKKAIDDHHRTPGAKVILTDLVSNVSGSVVAPLALPIGRLETPGGLSDRSSLASSRGGLSARRTPLGGAAASLMLQKEKLKSARR